MARSRQKKSAPTLPLPLVLGFFLLLFFIVSTLLLFSQYSDELRQTVKAHHWVEKFHHLNLRQALHSQSLHSSEAEAAPFPHGAAKAEAAPLQRGAGEKPQKALPQERPRAELRTVQSPVPRAQAEVPKQSSASAGTALQDLRTRAAAASGAIKVIWKLHTGKSCQNYADNDMRERSLEDSKEACNKNDACVAVVCATGKTEYCSLRAVANMVDYKPEDCYERLELNEDGHVLSTRVHPEYNNLLKHYPFQQVATQSGNQVNIMLVRSPPNRMQQELIKRYEKEILFLGISSMNDYPLSDNPADNYVGMFPGFLHMMREPEKAFPPHVKTLLMSQSDFQLPDVPARDYSRPKKYDFTYSASDCDVASDGHGWCGWSKNWSFVKEALPLMCGELKLKGVLVATKDKSGTKAYTIPKECEGRMIQTTYLPNQQDYFNYLKQSRFAFLPQVHDASPRVSTQALAHDVPILMNYYIKGGWKYVAPETGEFFHDMSDFKEKLVKILKASDEHQYEPRKWVKENYGDRKSGERLLKFVQDNFGDRVKLPRNTRYLQI